ncbi:GNAT family N-acetyltransferase [Streptomyces nondiastaticus]|uniref:GNAT family N-acetyltransferase n=1 Tax=Streptomyces nondiastaticus TaxID=3154512 RepID=UPI003F4D75B9
MPPTDPSTTPGAGPGLGAVPGPGPSSDGLAVTGTGGRLDDRACASAGDGAGPPTDNETTLELKLSEELTELLDHAPPEPAAITAGRGPAAAIGPGSDLLDSLPDWGPADTGAGTFQLVPVRVERDLRLITRWMNDPAVAAFWKLGGPESVTEAHLRVQTGGDGRSIPCLGVLDGVPMSYWEVYRADLDPIARHYPARPHDTGIHLLIGKVADRGRGLGTRLLRTVADLVLEHRPSCGRVVAEPDLRNTPCVSAFLSAGFRLMAEVDLPDKRAALVVRDRSLRTLL